MVRQAPYARCVILLAGHSFSDGWSGVEGHTALASKGVNLADDLKERQWYGSIKRL